MLLRTHGGYQGWNDDRILTEIPYSRFTQDVRLAVENITTERTDEYRLAAFHGWQNANVQGALRKGTTFEKYLRNLGLAPKKTVATGQIARERTAAHERANSVQEAFRRRPRE
jgi:hypothetical protein